MASKKFRNKQCTYCGSISRPTTNDHVIGRRFLSELSDRVLPQVPACEVCNNRKSKLELYLMSILPLAARHPGKASALSASARRLKRNAALLEEIATQQKSTWITVNGLLQPATTLPLNSAKIQELSCFLVRGLARHHFGLVIPQDQFVDAGIFNSVGEREFTRMLALNGERVRDDIGRGAFVYEGVRASDSPTLTLWRFIFYGGVRLGGDPHQTRDVASTVWAMSAPRPIGAIFGHDERQDGDRLGREALP